MNPTLADARAAGPVAVAQYLRASHLQMLVTEAGRGVDDATLAMRRCGALAADDDDVAELAALLVQAEAVIDRLTRKIPEGW